MTAPRRNFWPALLTSVIALSSLTATACNGVGPAFRQGTELRFMIPRNGGTVQLPSTVRWTGHLPSGGSYGVYIDETPQPPGKTIWYLVENGVGCTSQQMCATRQNLQAHGADYTTAPEYQLTPTDFSSKSGLHQVTVVVLDSQLRRVNENSYTVTVRIKRGA